MRQVFKPLSWIAGLAGLTAVIVYFGPSKLPALLHTVGITGIVGWIIATLAARVALTETTTAPLAALGFAMRRSDAFWVGWLRTFANQVFPSAGVVAYTQAIRRKVDISWSELAAMAAPQFVLAAGALGLVGLAAILFSYDRVDDSRTVLLIAYGLVVAAAWVIARGAHGFLRVLPGAIARRVSATSDALRKLAQHPAMMLWVVACHMLAILFRGLRLWLLFELAGAHLEWNEALLVVAIAESGMLIQLTPGGLGIREGAVMAGAFLVGAPSDIAAGVAIIDRLLVIAITLVLTPPAILILRGGQREPSD